MCTFPLLILGHSKAVRDICFNNTGTQFLSAAYDRYLKLWDSETGRLYHSDVSFLLFTQPHVVVLHNY